MTEEKKEMDGFLPAKVQVRTEYGLRTPSNDPVHYNNHDMVACAEELAWFTQNLADAQAWSDKMNRKLVDYGATGAFRVVKRTVTTTTSAWEEL